MKYKILSILLLFCTFTCTACAKGYKIEVSIPSKPNSKVYIAKYWNNAPYAIDSVVLSNEGKGVFLSENKIEQGQYLLFARPEIQLDILIGTKKVDMKLDIDVSDIENCKVTGSKDTELLWQYLAQQAKHAEEVEKIESELEKSGLSQEKVDQLLFDLNKINKDFDTYTQSTISQHNKEWFGIFLKGLTPIALPHSNARTEAEYRANKQYYANHYFDNIALTDPRVWTTNYLNSTIDRYMEELVSWHPDSLANAASRLVEMVKGNQFAFEKMASKFINESSQSKIMGRENIWAKVFEDHIDAKNLDWIDSQSLSKLKMEYELLKNNRIGMTAKNMKLVTIGGDTINTNDIVANYLVLFFYSTDCSHCHHEAPLLEEVRQKYEAQGLKVLAMDLLASNQSNQWDSFVKRFKLENWINAADPDYKSEHWLNYDVSGTPSVYLLDKEKKIIGRKINSKSLVQLLDGYIELNKEK